MHYLVTGGLGYAGSWLTYGLAKTGNTVTVLSRSTKAPDLGVPYTLLTADITDETSVRNALALRQFDCCIHAASCNETNSPEYAKQALSVNGYGTHVVTSLLAEQELKAFLYLSTYHVYGKHEGEITETTPVAPQSDYALSHLVGEEYVQRCHRQTNFPTTILRLTNGYGHPRTPNFTKWYLLIHDMCRMAVRQGKITLRSSPDITRDFIWLGDLAPLVEKLVNKEESRGKILNVSSEKTRSLHEIATVVAKVYKARTGNSLPVSYPEEQSSKADLKIHSSRLQQIVDGFRFTNALEQEIATTMHILETTHCG